MFGLFKWTYFMDDVLQQSRFFALCGTSGVLYNMSNGKKYNLIPRENRMLVFIPK